MENSKIEWTTHTFNPWLGCTKVSPACVNCYAERDMTNKKNGVIWGAGNPRKRTTVATWNKVLQWNKDAVIDGENRPRVFCSSLADVFDSEVLEQWRTDLFNLIGQCDNLDWLLLTKRPENVISMLPVEWTWPGKVKNNLWIGTSVENQEYANKRIPILLNIPAAVHFISCEPLLGPIDLTNLCKNEMYDLDWIIAGGESGPKARSMNPDWARSLRDQSIELGVKFLFKQWGEFDADSKLVGKIVAGRKLDGRTWDWYPKSITGSVLLKYPYINS
jgi:protein gp37